jgi:hypothetical protein
MYTWGIQKSSVSNKNFLELRNFIYYIGGFGQLVHDESKYHRVIPMVSL